MKSLASVARRAFLTLSCGPLLCLAGACSDGHSGASSESVEAAQYSAEVPNRWFELLYAVVKKHRTAPPMASRYYGYTGIALHEAVVHGIAGQRSLSGQLNELPALPAPENRAYHWPTVANAALAVVIAGFYPAEAAEVGALEAEIRGQQTADEAELSRSVEYGQAVGRDILAWAASDGSADLAGCNAGFVPPRDPSEGGWVPAGGGSGVGLEPCWGTVRPFVLPDAGECAAPDPPAYSTSPSSAFYAHALAVYNTTGDAGAALTDDQVVIAHYWADGAGDTGTPPGHWVALVGAMLEQHDLSLAVAAEAYARVGMAVADAFIVCWHQKYDTYLLRPISYIRANIDPDWDPLLATPGFPSYTSGHSTQSGAAAMALTTYFGPMAFTDTTHSRLNPELGLADRSFTSFYDAAAEAAVSRLYGGIHYIFDNQAGFDQGLCIGALQDSMVHYRE